MGHVYYHYPGDKQFSLDFVNPDSDEVVSRIVAYDDEVAVKVSKYDLEREFYVVYTSRAGGGTVRDMEFDPDNALAEMDDDNGTIVARLLEIYQSVIDQNEEEENTPVEAYKNIHIDRLSDALDRVM